MFAKLKLAVVATLAVMAVACTSAPAQPTTIISVPITPNPSASALPSAEPSAQPSISQSSLLPTGGPSLPPASSVPASTTPTLTPTATPSPTPKPVPTILTFKAPKTNDCVTSMTIHLSWTIANATGATISIDGGGVYQSYPGTSGSADVPFSCTDTGMHTYVLTTTGGHGPAASKTKIVTQSPSASPSESPSASA